MIVISIESPRSKEAIDLLDSSIAFTHSLYDEEKDYCYDLDKISEFFIVRNEGIAIGCGAYSWIGEYHIEVKHIFLYETARGLGCGRKLMEYIEARALEIGAEYIILETTQKQKEAIGLYLKLGFQLIEPYKSVIHNEQMFMSKNLY